MRNHQEKQEYIFTGSLYLPNKLSLKLKGEFICDSSSSLEGKMIYNGEARDTIQGNLINAQRFCMPGSETNPRNFLMFAHFSKMFPNHHYFLAKKGNNFEGKYIGRANLEEGKIRGINPALYSGIIQFADIHLQNKDNYKIEIKVFRK